VNARKIIYLDNAATSFPKPPEVGAAMKEFIETSAGNPGRGAHEIARRAEVTVNGARRALARLLGVPNPDRLIFTLNATDAIHIALDGLLSAGDHVVVSPFEHNSVMRPLREWEKRGLRVTVVPPAGNSVDPESFQAALRPETKLLICTHASNVTGAAMPVESVSAVARSAGRAFLIDAAQTVGHLPIGIPKIGAGLVAFSCHKGLLGPPGLGALYIAETVRLRPVRAGGTGTMSESEHQPEEYPHSHESGTLNTVGLAGLAAALRFIEENGMERLAEIQNGLAAKLADALAGFSGVRIVGGATGKMPVPLIGATRAPIVSLSIGGVDPHEAAAVLDAKYGIAVRAGLHCAPAAHKALGTFPAGTLRVSPGAFNTEQDIDDFIKAFSETLKMLKR
jgi:cysteine desulfurase family protein